MFKNPALILCLSPFVLNGCSSLENNTFRDFLTDTNIHSSPIEHQADVKDYDPVLDSTRRALQSNPVPLVINSPPNVDTGANLEPEFDDVWERLSSGFTFSDIDNHRIEQQKQWFLKHESYLATVSKRAEPFLFLIAEEVEKRQLPGEIALVPIIESAFQPQAHSRQKAAGLWQFIPSTARHFGLKQNWWYDARRDVYLSTHAALTYLEQLNKYYNGDWLLTLAAYNAGTGNVNKAVRKNRKLGKAIDYWSLDLPRETKNYVPKLIAVAKLIQKHEQYGLSLNGIDNIAQLKLVDTGSQIDLSLVAQMTGISIEELKTFNPAIKQWATDPNGPHHLLLPVDSVNEFNTQLAMVDDKDRVQHFRHQIRSGESLSVIARKYNLSIRALKTANHLKSNRIRAGKYLMIPIPKGQKMPSVTRVADVKSTSPASKGTTYTVRQGDSFWKIAKKFNTSHQQLAAVNGLSEHTTLSIGQVLTVKPSNRYTAKKVSSSASKPINYKVKRGDSLYLISRRFNVTINELKRWNGLQNKKYLQPGQELKVYITIAESQAI